MNKTVLGYKIVIEISKADWKSQVIWKVNKKYDKKLPNDLHGKIERIKIIRTLVDTVPRGQLGFTNDVDCPSLTECKRFVEENW